MIGAPNVGCEDGDCPLPKGVLESVVSWTTATRCYMGVPAGSVETVRLMVFACAIIVTAARIVLQTPKRSSAHSAAVGTAAPGRRFVSASNTSFAILTFFMG